MSNQLTAWPGKILLRQHKQKDVTDGGIVLPGSAVSKLKQGTVVVHCKLDVDSPYPQLEPGDTVVFSGYTGNEIEWNGETLLMIPDDDTAVCGYCRKETTNAN